MNFIPRIRAGSSCIGTQTFIRLLSTSSNKGKDITTEVLNKKMSQLITSSDVLGICRLIDQDRIPIDPIATDGWIPANPGLKRVVNQNDFILRCIDLDNIELVKELSKNGYGPLPEQFVPLRQSDRTWCLIGSYRPDPLLYAIFKNKMKFALTILKSNQKYKLDDTYCFPIKTLLWNNPEISTKESCNIELSPLTVALMYPTKTQATKRKVKKLLMLGAKKELPKINIADICNNSQRNAILKWNLEEKRKVHELFLNNFF